MSVIIRLEGTAAGVPTPFDGLFVRLYDPTVPIGGDGGILEVTDDPRRALRFADIAEAMATYRKPYGIRPDGEYNRPLTAWTISIQQAPEQ